MIGSLISAIIVGGILGALARLAVPGEQDLSIPKTVGLGILGGIIGGFVGGLIDAGWFLGPLLSLLATAGLIVGGLRAGVLANK